MKFICSRLKAVFGLASLTLLSTFSLPNPNVQHKNFLKAASYSRFTLKTSLSKQHLLISKNSKEFSEFLLGFLYFGFYKYKNSKQFLDLIDYAGLFQELKKIDGDKEKTKNILEVMKRTKWKGKHPLSIYKSEVDNGSLVYKKLTRLLKEKLKEEDQTKYLKNLEEEIDAIIKSFDDDDEDSKKRIAELEKFELELSK